MPVSFPSVSDVPLAKSPLSEVICQVRFPPVLAILTSPPSQVQERIRQSFPWFDVMSDAGTASPVYRFRSKDEHNTVTLTVDSYALSTDLYTVWEDFAQDLAEIHDVIQAIYQLPFFTRVGLRYVNLFSRSNTGGENLDDIGSVLRPDLVSLLKSPAWEQPEELMSQVLLGNDKGKLLLRVGARAPSKEEPLVFLDLDFFEEGDLPVGEVVERCFRYHNMIYDAFRWSVREDCLSLFEPRPKGER